MTKEKLFLLDVLGGFIRGEKLNFDTELDFNELMRLAHINSLSGILGYMAMQNPCGRTKELAESLKKQCLTSVAVFTQRGEMAQKLLASLNENSIDHLLLKGYAVREWYPVPELRSYGDVDLLIKPADRKKAHDLMLSLGFSVKEDWEPIYSYRRGTELYELHTEPMEIDIFDSVSCRDYFSTAWEHAEKIGEHTYVPTPEFHFLYLIAHIAKHIRGSGAGIRMYLDLAAFILRFGGTADWEYIDRILGELELKSFANTALTLVEKCFGIESPLALSEIDEEVFESFLDCTINGGVFGKLTSDKGLVTLKNAGGKSRTAALTERIFPAASTIERRYTYLQGRHWLLPVAWVHRVFKNRSLWKERAREVKRIINTDEEELTRLKQFYKEIGL